VLVHPPWIERNGNHERYRIRGFGAGPCHKPTLWVSDAGLDQHQLGTHPTGHGECGSDTYCGGIRDKLDAWRSGGDAGDQIGRTCTRGGRAQLEACARNRSLHRGGGDAARGRR
jgi:hypothetical protein